MSAITIQNDHAYPIDEPNLQQAVQAVIARHDIDADSGVTVVITDNATVQTLNDRYRHINQVTDILSFPCDPLPDAVPSAPYLGDLIIAYPYTRAQASRLGHTLNESLVLLVVHGTLHLLGYTHDTMAHRAQMWAEQAHILTQLAIDTAIVPMLEGLDDHA